MGARVIIASLVALAGWSGSGDDAAPGDRAADTDLARTTVEGGDADEFPLGAVYGVWRRRRRRTGRIDAAESAAADEESAPTAGDE